MLHTWTRVLRVLITVHLTAASYNALIHLIASRSAHPWRPELEQSASSLSFLVAAFVFAIWMWFATKALAARIRTRLPIGPFWSVVCCLVPIILFANLPMEMLAVRTGIAPGPEWFFKKLSNVRELNWWAGLITVGSVLSSLGIFSPTSSDDLPGMRRTLLVIAIGRALWVLGGVFLLILIVEIDRRLEKMPVASVA